MRSLSVLFLYVGALCSAAPLYAQAPPPAQAPAATAPQPTFVPVLRNLTRLESWSFFEPPPGGGNPDYAHIGNRLTFGAEARHRRVDGTLLLQYVQFGGLPADAVGPGPLGTGGAYFQHAGRTDSRQLYLRALNVRFKQLFPGFDLQVGRMGYTSGAEWVSGVPKIEAVKRQRLDARLLGEFEWSIYQRAYDGLRADWTGEAVRVTGSVLRPTQGGFEDAAGVSIDNITVVSGVATFRPNAPVRGAEWQVFSHYYDDSRAVAGRPDNTGRPASRVDVQIATIGTSLVGAWNTGAGQGDALVWLAAQGGSWYEQTHRGFSIAAEAGHQWPRAGWQPWVRAGLLYASGDDDPGDDRHGTFFQVLPTVRRFSLSTVYNLMNLNDRFVQVLLRPRPALGLRADVHWLSLANAADGWYSGSGATQEEGRIFGYAMRPSGGARGLGTIVEGAADYTVNRHLNVNAYLGVMRGGDVVRRSFRGDRLTFGYVETQLRF
jgi:hypothetical protein